MPFVGQDHTGKVWPPSAGHCRQICGPDAEFARQARAALRASQTGK